MFRRTLPEKDRGKVRVYLHTLAQAPDGMNLPELVQLFLHEVAAYPMGITVRLNTGEGAIVINSNLGIPARPVVRIVKGTDGRGSNVFYEYDLSEPEHQHRMVVAVLDY